MIPPLDRKPDPTPAPPPKRYPFDRVTSCCAGQIRQLPPMPPEVRRLVEWAEGAEAQMESDRGPSKTHPTEGEQIIAAVRRIFRSEP